VTTLATSVNIGKKPDPVTLTDTARPEGAMERLRRRFPHILTLEFKPEGVRADQRSYRERVR